MGLVVHKSPGLGRNSHSRVAGALPNWNRFKRQWEKRQKTVDMLNSFKEIHTKGNERDGHIIEGEKKVKIRSLKVGEKIKYLHYNGTDR